VYNYLAVNKKRERTAWICNASLVHHNAIQKYCLELGPMNIFNSPELVANKQVITNTRKKKKNNTLNKYWMFKQQIRQMYHRWRPQRHQAKEHNTLYTCCEHVNVRGYICNFIRRKTANI